MSMDNKYAGSDFPFNNQAMTPAAFQPSDTNSFITKSTFYSSISGSYFNYYQRFVRRWFYWYDGWDPDFHNAVTGIFSTRIATAIVDKIAKKVTGGRIMFKIKGYDKSKDGKANSSLAFISDEWSDKANFAEAVKNGALYAAAGGTSLAKLNLDRDGELWIDVLRMDQFHPVIGFRGQVLGVKSFLKRYAKTTQEIISDKENNTKLADTSYYIVEHRYFGAFKRLDGTTINDCPLVEYKVFQFQGTIVNGTDYALNSQQSLKWENLPKTVRKSILNDYGIGFVVSKPLRLPFTNHLGCELVKWTGSMPGLPELPFGESVINKILACCLTYDYAFAAFATDLYLGKGNVIMPANMIGGQGATVAGNSGGSNFYSKLDSFIYKMVPNLSLENQKPIPIQFDLRADNWETIQNKLFKQIALHIGVNPSFISASLNDNTARTAREVSTEENDTAEYVNDTREILEKPFNRLLELVLKCKAENSDNPELYSDNVVIRWSSAGLTNRSTLAEIVNSCVQAGTMSLEKATRMLNYDDDELQVQEEYNRITQEKKENMIGQTEINKSNFYNEG